MMSLIAKRTKNEKGLTLIELLAVVVILGIIAAIAVPAIGNIIDNTRIDATVSEGLNIINAAKLVHAQGGGTLNAGTTTFDATALQPHVPSYDMTTVGSDTDVTVTHTNGVYTLNNYNGLATLPAGLTGTTEAELAAFLD